MSMRKGRTRFLSFAGLLCLLLQLPLSLLAQEGTRPLIFRNARIFDGSRVIDRGTVAVEDGKIRTTGVRVRMPPHAGLTPS